MSNMDYATHSTGEHAMAEEDLCRAVGEDLQRAYANYPWMVGCNVAAGTVVINLPEPWKPLKYRNYGILLHMGSLMGPGGQKKVLYAGGELLERMGLPREAAPANAGQKAKENGMDVANAVGNSKGSTI
jgi:hypothetical protein